MPIPAQSSATAPGYPSDVLVGGEHLIVDRPLAASKTFLPFAFLVRDGGYFRPTNAAYVDATAWAADTAKALGAIVRPATRPVTVTQAGTGNGTVTATASAAALAGLWRATCIAAATNGGTFRLIDPAGTDVGSVPVGTATTLGGVTVTISDGATDFVRGDRVFIMVEQLHAYQASAVAGDTKTHATTEPTWPINGTTVVDDQVTWTDLGTVDQLSDFGQYGVFSYAGDAVVVGAAAHPMMPVIVAGQVKRALVSGLPAAYTAGSRLGLLFLE
jgi:hypothetical protein